MLYVVLHFMDRRFLYQRLSLYRTCHLYKEPPLDTVLSRFIPCHVRGCIQKFPEWVDNEINDSNKHSLRSKTKGFFSPTGFCSPYRTLAFLNGLLEPQTFGRTTWLGDQSNTRSLPKHRTTQHRNTQTYIHAPSRIRTCDLNIQAVVDSTCLRNTKGYGGKTH
jgi:hypothetical protein